jgi:Transposase zinc-binding domain
MTRCRTVALGGHVDVCPQCGGDPAISYNSCRNRHCNKCQTPARRRWIDARKQELLQTRLCVVRRYVVLKVDEACGGARFRF